MARQKGIAKLTGTLGGINFYFRKGKPVAREAGGGFSSEAIKKSPEMERVRENSSEFGMVSKAKKLVRLGLYPFLRDYADVTLHGRMMTLFQQIKVLDTVSVRGQRLFQSGLATDEGRWLLQQFDFTAQKAGTMLPGDGQFNLDEQSYTVTAITPEKLRLPKGATGLQLCFGVLQADFATGTFTFFSSDAVFVAADFGDNSLTLTPEFLPTGAGDHIAVLQVRYYQEVNGKRFLFKDLALQGLEVLGVY